VPGECGVKGEEGRVAAFPGSRGNNLGKANLSRSLHVRVVFFSKRDVFILN